MFLYRQKLGFFEPETRSSLRKALVAERRGDVQEAEERFHDALHASVDSHGNHSVTNTIFPSFTYISVFL